jgi:hypothetical protein
LETALGDVKPIAVDAGLVDELAWLRFGDRRTPILLRLLFPHMVHSGPGPVRLDKDHVFPFSRFAEESKAPKGVPGKEWQQLRLWADRLPNIQLLRIEDNRGGGKVATLPKFWLAGLSATSRRRYSQQHVKHVPAAVADAMPFWERRYEALVADIKRLLAP